jgi:hypothetical protein
MKKCDSLLIYLRHITGKQMGGGVLVEVCLLILLETIGGNTPKLTTDMGKYLQN